jgi:hypothetical protein
MALLLSDRHAVQGDGRLLVETMWNVEIDETRMERFLRPTESKCEIVVLVVFERPAAM